MLFFKKKKEKEKERSVCMCAFYRRTRKKRGVYKSRNIMTHEGELRDRQPNLG